MAWHCGEWRRPRAARSQTDSCADAGIENGVFYSEEQFEESARAAERSAPWLRDHKASSLPAAFGKGVLHISARADHGGGPKHILTLLNQWPSGSLPVAVACPDDHPYWAQFSDAVGSSSMFRLPHRRFDVREAWRLRRWVLDRGFALLHAHGKGASVYARFVAMGTGVPVVYTPHGIHTGQYNAMLKAAYLGFEKLAQGWLSGVIFVSPSERLQAEDMGLWRRRPHWLVPNGVPMPAAQRIETARSYGRDLLGLAGSQVVVLTASRFDYQKNMQAALTMARSCPELVFVWLGEGPDKALLSRQAAQEGLTNIRFIGAVDDPEPYFAAADIYLTCARWEGMPLAVIEAMAHGMPIVASNVVGNRDLVDHGRTGTLFDDGELEAAIAALKRLASDETLRRRLGRQAREIQQDKHSVASMAAKTWAVYEAVLDAANT